jgi:hypothetical protein
MIQLSAAPSTVFPLFEPIGEKRWASDWEPEMIYPQSGVTETGAVFTTEDHHGSKTIWMIITYDPRRFQIAYLRITPDSNLAWIEIRCEDKRNGTTLARVSYTFTALTEKGNIYINEFTEEYYRRWIRHWEEAINHYLQYGRTLEHH